MGMFDAILGPVKAVAGLGFKSGSESTSSSGTQKTYRDIPQEGIDKLVYDILSSDQGLASLASGENLSGGFNSSSKTLLAQDLVTKIAGELAVITAPTITESQQSSKSKSKSSPLPSVICTELVRQGLLTQEVYDLGEVPFKNLNPILVRGYHYLAAPVVLRMREDKELSERLLKWVLCRFNWYYGKKTLRGGITIFLGHPLCFLVGLFVTKKEHQNALAN